MDKYIYAYFNTLGGFFGKPFVEDLPSEEFIHGFYQGLYGADLATLNSIKEDDLYLIGKFNNVTGDIVSCKECIAHLCDIATTIISKKFPSEVIKDEKN